MIYADYAATTPLDEDVKKVMIRSFENDFGNASSVHSFGRSARHTAEEARESIAEIFNVNKNEIYFTSGGTESDNWALQGIARKYKSGHIIASAAEHHAVLNTLEFLKKNGFDITFLPLDKSGRVNAETVKNAIRPDTRLVSVMAANNEIGTVMPINEICTVAKEKNIPFFTDAVQASGTLDIDASEMSFLSASAHKIYGPKGIGLLYIKEGTGIENLMFGGSQERDRRPGTTPVPLIAGFAAALKKYKDNREEYNSVARTRCNRVKEIVLSELPFAKLNGDEINRLPGNLNFWFEDVQAESLLLLLDLAGIACSAGAACSAGSVKVSHVISALPERGVQAAQSSLRISLSHLTSEAEAEIIGKTIVENVKKIKP